MWKQIKEKIKTLGFKGIFFMHLGFLSCAIATVIFISPTGMVTGGATGLAIWLSQLTKMEYYLFLYGINFILIIFSFILLGNEFTIKTIYGSIMLPTFGVLVIWLLNLFHIQIDELVLVCDPLIIVIFAACCMGFGIGMNMKLGGSTGGFDILESIFLKYFHISYSTSIYLLDALLVIMGMTTFKGNEIFQNAFAEGLAAVLYIIIVGVVVDTITFGGYNKRAVFIRSKKYEEIHDGIIKVLIRGLTYLKAEGGYSKEETKMIVCICYSREYFALREMVLRIDPNAFIFVTKATEVRGLGFSIETPEHLARHKLKKNRDGNEKKTSL